MLVQQLRAVDVEEGVYDLVSHEAWGMDRGPKRILYLLVVDEKECDLFPHEGKEIDRGRKRICPWTKKIVITAGRGQKQICLFSLLLFTVLLWKYSI
jgi:hypothetical protein